MTILQTPIVSTDQHIRRLYIPSGTSNRNRHMNKGVLGNETRELGPEYDSRLGRRARWGRT